MNGRSRSRSPSGNPQLQSSVALSDDASQVMRDRLMSKLSAACCSSTVVEAIANDVIQELDTVASKPSAAEDSTNVLWAIGLKFVTYTLLKPDELIPHEVLEGFNHLGQATGCHADILKLGEELSAWASNQHDSSARDALVRMSSLASASQAMVLHPEVCEKLLSHVNHFLVQSRSQCFICLENFVELCPAGDTLIVAHCGHAVHHGCFIDAVIPMSARVQEPLGGQELRGRCRLCWQPCRWSSATKVLWVAKAVKIMSEAIPRMLSRSAAMPIPEGIAGSSLQDVFGELLLCIGGGKSIALMCEMFATEVFGDAEMRWFFWRASLEKLELSGVTIPEYLKSATERFLNTIHDNTEGEDAVEDGEDEEDVEEEDMMERGEEEDVLDASDEAEEQA